MLVSSIQQGDSVIHIHVFILFQILFLFRLLQNIEQSSLCYTVGPRWLSILNIAVCREQSQTPSLSLPTIQNYYFSSGAKGPGPHSGCNWINTMNMKSLSSHMLVRQLSTFILPSPTHSPGNFWDPSELGYVLLRGFLLRYLALVFATRTLLGYPARLDPAVLCRWLQWVLGGPNVQTVEDGPPTSFVIQSVTLSLEPPSSQTEPLESTSLPLWGPTPSVNSDGEGEG